MKRRTLRGEVSLQHAQALQSNMLVEFHLPEREQEFLTHLVNNQHIIAATIAQHMNASRPPSCEVSPSDEWIKGSFNVCIPVSISNHPIQRVIIRFPLPYKIGELNFPGNTDEKLITEAATYALLDENCPEVPKPRLLGYALSDGRRYTRLDNMPLFTRLIQSFRRQALKWLGRPAPCQYIPHKTSAMNTGYLLLEDIQKDGTAMLSDTWEKNRNDSSKRQNLFRDLARIILAVGRVPVPRIGSFTIDNWGYLQLNNRPVTMTIYQLENEGINTGIERSNTFSNALDYGLDLVGFHDRYFRDQPNAVVSEEDGQMQMTAFACMRMMLPHFFPKSTRNGPFTFQLTDLHQSNLFVDEDWHITSVIDFEFAAALPPEMELTPYWLSNHDLGDLKRHPENFNAVHDEFITLLREECTRLKIPVSRADAMQQTWHTNGFFFQHSLSLRIGCITLFEPVLSLFEPEFVWDPIFIKHLAPLWATDGKQVLARKMKDKEKYDQDIQDLFEV